MELAKQGQFDGLMKVKKVKAGTAFEFNNEMVKSLEWSESRGTRLYFDKSLGLLFLHHKHSNGLWAFGLPNIAFMQFFDDTVKHIPAANADMQNPVKEEIKKVKSQSARIVIHEEEKVVPVRRGLHGENNHVETIPRRRRSFKESDVIPSKKAKVSKNLEIVDPDLDD